MYGHLIDNKLVITELPLKTSMGEIFTNNPKVFLEYGEKAVIEKRPPKNNYQGEYIKEYSETDTEILINWKFVPYSPEKLREQYQNLTVQFIRRKYSADDENQILREYLAYGAEFKPAFDAYNAYVEECRKEARQKVYEGV